MADQVPDEVAAFEAQLAQVGEVGGPTPAFSPGAVLLLLYPHRDGIGLLATARSAHMPQHGGQISLPGGGMRSGETPAETALRETEEELGIPRDRITLLGSFGHFALPVSGWDVVAHLGWWDGAGPLQRQESEVEAILEVPLEVLARQHRRHFAGCAFTPHEYPEYFHQQDDREYRIWGCTARVLHHFLETVYEPVARKA